MVRINLGSGHWKFEGWVNVDLDAGSAPEVCADLSAGLPFQTGVADPFFANVTGFSNPAACCGY
jgi:hypothetical protein